MKSVSAIRTLVYALFRQAGCHSIGLIAAGVSFLLFLSLPAILTSVISLYGLISDPSDVVGIIGQLKNIFPDAVVYFLSSQAQMTAARSQVTLGLGFFASLFVAVLGARAATAAVMTALDIAYSVDRGRGLVRFQLVAIGLTICSALYGLFAITLLAILPLATEFFHLGAEIKIIAQWGRWPAFVVLVILFLGAIYRFAPARKRTHWRWISPGAVLAAVLWLLLSFLFSLYVARFAPYQAAFGPSSSVVVMLTWLFLSVYSVLLGAELNAILAGVNNRTEVLPKNP